MSKWGDISLELGCIQNALTDMVAVSDTRVRITIPVLKAHQVQMVPTERTGLPLAL